MIARGLRALLSCGSVAFALSACTATIPEGQLRCDDAARDCPPGWSCVTGFCYSTAIDAGALEDGGPFDAGDRADAGGTDGGGDAGPLDGGALDGGALDGGALDAGPPEELAQVALGDQHSCARTTRGRVFCWGANAEGQLGDDSTVRRTVATEVSTLLPPADEICAGELHSCARAAGSLWCWGSNAQGQLGVGMATARSDVPLMVVGSGASALTCGNQHTCAVIDGAVWCWGRNDSGMVGDGTRMGPRAAPTRVMGLDGAAILAIDAGGAHTCAVLADGAVRCWGYNSSGQIGDMDTPANLFAAATTPVDVDGLSDAARVAGGGAFTCALRSGGAVVCWGANGNRQLGSPGADRQVPGADVVLASSASAIATGGYHACALGPALPLTCWGRNNHGQVGTGTATPFVDPAPTAVLSVLGALRSIDAGTEHTCAAEATRVLCWGSNTSGQLGDASTTESATPVEVLGIDL